jgi:hypothetical protein
MTGALNMGSKQITALADGSAAAHAATLSQIQNAAHVYATTAGAANVQTAAFTPTVAAYAAGQTFVIKIGAGLTNTAATTLNVDGRGAKNVFLNGAALAGGELVAGEIYVVVYDGTQLQIVGAGGGAAFTVRSAELVTASAPDDTPTEMEWNSVLWDYDNMWASGNKERLTGPVAGIYGFSLQIGWAADATGYRSAVVYDDADTIIGTDIVIPGAATVCYNHVVGQVNLAAADYITATVQQDSGGVLAITYPRFDMWLIRKL